MREVERTRIPTLEMRERNLFKAPRVNTLPVCNTLPKESFYFVTAMTFLRARGGAVVEALRYKQEDRGIDSP
jgi:hypothetical protein